MRLLLNRTDMPVLAILCLSTWSCKTTSGIDDMEVTAEQCQDGLDNDHDGLTDCDDPGCQGFVFCVDGGPAGDTDTDSDSDGVSDAGRDSGGGSDSDSDTDIDAGDDAGGYIDDDTNFPGEFHCNFSTAFTAQCCYEYAKGVSESDAQADCATHKQYGPGGLATTSKVFGSGPCTLIVTGFCVTAGQTPGGREYMNNTLVTGSADCNPGTATSSAWGCEPMSGGEYTCTL